VEVGAPGVSASVYGAGRHPHLVSASLLAMMQAINRLSYRAGWVGAPSQAGDVVAVVPALAFAKTVAVDAADAIKAVGASTAAPKVAA
jgi:hypothetical protein